MSTYDLGPLAEDLRGLIEAERGRPGMPDVVRARLAARLGVPIGGGGGGPEDGGPGSGPGGTTPTTTPHGPPNPPAAASVPRLPPIAHPGWLAGATFALGLAGGAGIHSLYDHRVAPPHAISIARQPAVADAPIAVAELQPPPTTIALPPPAPVAVAPAPVVAAPVEVTEAAAPSRHRHGSSSAARHEARREEARTADPSAAEAASRDKDLGTENALLQMARTALSRGQAAATIDALERHARQFPHARLVEERESLYVQALVQAGRSKEARERGERFRHRFPHSLFLPAVEAALKQAS